MQGKGLVKFFLGFMALVCLYQFVLIFPTAKVEKNAKKYAEAKVVGLPDGILKRDSLRSAESLFLDSMSSETVMAVPMIRDFTYQDLKGQQLALGLDLKGGMSVVMQVDLKELIVELSRDSKDEDFRAALQAAKEKQKSDNRDYVALFAEAFKAKAGSGKKLASIFGKNASLNDQINFESSDDDVIELIRKEADEAVDMTFKMLKKRIDKFGVTQPTVTLDPNTDRILVELPGVQNPARARKYLQGKAELNFWNVYRVTDQGILPALNEANEVLRKRALRLEDGSNGNASTETLTETETDSNDTSALAEEATDPNDTTVVAEATEEADSSQLAVDDFADAGQGPLFEKLAVNQGAFQLCVAGTALSKDKGAIDKLLALPEVKKLFPKDLVFYWGDKEYKENGTPTKRKMLYMVRSYGKKNAPLTGDNVDNASKQSDQMDGIVVSLRMDSEGTKIWGRETQKAAKDNNREIAIVLDNEVVSAPRVNDAIMNGNSQISGNFSVQEAQDLANVLQIGKLPARPEIIQEAIVGPTLGASNIRKSMMSLIIGFCLVLGFMMYYYNRAGIVSIIALFANLYFIFGALASMGTVLTLPGIAGVILTIGMAVDANVIIFERIREELRLGKTTMMAIRDGFSQSYSAIIDANVTTILVAMVLFYFGLGPIKGFAAVLIVGVLSSLFTAVLVTRLIIDWWMDQGKELTFSSASTEKAFANWNVDFLGKRKTAYMTSGVIILIGIISMFTNKFELGVDFKGGYSYTVQFDQDIKNEDVRNELKEVFEGEAPLVKTFGEANTLEITTSYKIKEQSAEADSVVKLRLYEGINKLVGGGLAYADFYDLGSPTTHVTGSNTVGPTIADDIVNSSLWATIFALLCIFVYILIRFRKWQYSAGAVAALFHDVLIVLSVFSIFHGILPFSMQVDQAFIAAILTVIGYSINDTVVVFDRIREYMDQYKKTSQEEVINLAVNNTVSRTIITSLTTLLVVTILLVFGGSSIKGFAFALFVGIIVGTYSSIFVATPIVHDLTKGEEVKAVSEKKEESVKA